jgi:hypothetical protein
MNRKILFVTIMVTCLGLLPFAAVGNGSNDSISATVKLKIGDKISTVEISKITKDKNGNPTLTLFSSAISGSISMSSTSDMCPVVACVVLDDGTIIDPMPVAGGLKGGAGFSFLSESILTKNPEDKGGGGSWKASGNVPVGYFTYSFNTDKPISKIIVGKYADYAKSDYKAFVSTTYKK